MVIISKSVVNGDIHAAFGSSSGNGNTKLTISSSCPKAEAGFKGLVVRQIKWYASWVQNAVRQFGPYLSLTKEN